MSRGPIPPVPLDQLPERYKTSVDLMDRLVGDPYTIQVFAHSQAMTDFYYDEFYAKAFYNGDPRMKTDNRTKQLARLRIGKRHGCAVCNRSNEEEAQQIGFTAAQVDAMFEDKPNPSLFTSAELAVIDFIDQLVHTNPEGSVDQALYDRLRSHHTDEQIVELAFVAAIFVGVSKMNIALGMVPRDPVCEFAPRAPAKESEPA